MSAVSFASAGYVCQQGQLAPAPAIICQEQIAGFIEANGVITGTVEVCDEALLMLATGWTTSPGPYTEAEILALSQYAAPQMRSGIFQVNLCPQDAYLVAVYSDDYNGALPGNFFIGNFLPGGASEIQTGLSMSVPSGTALFTVARSVLKVTSTGINWQRTG